MNLSAVEPPAGSRVTSAHQPGTPPPPKWKAAFGPFLLSPEERLLLRDGAPVRLGGRALDLLIALVDNAGSVVSKKDLIDRVWGDVVVDEGNLRFNMYAVRKALGDGAEGARYVVNTANKGYSFVAGVERQAPAGDPHAEPPRRSRSLPALATPVVGRDSEIALIETGLLQRRLVSIVGPGGIGKTTAAIACAQNAARHFDGDVCFIDLSATSDAALIRGAVATAIGLQSDLGALSAIMAHIVDRKLLLVLDCCEHVIADAAETAETLVRNCPFVHVLATSREPLRAGGEFVYRLQPLSFPPEGEGMSAAAALAYPAVRLFVDRAAASGAGFELNDNDAPLVSQLCRELDGIALAIELAAGRIEALGLQVITSHLDASMKLMWHGRRTAVSRHQTLGATLDWSFNLLGLDERRLLCRLSVFAGSFALDAAIGVCAFDLDPPEAIELIAGLVSKSLVNVDAGGPALRYGLLDTTKSYCGTKLSGFEDAGAIAKRFCDHFSALAQHCASQALCKESLEALSLELPNLRAALERRLRDADDAAGAVKLAAALCPLLLQMSRLTECLRWARAAIAAMPFELRATIFEMRLQAALGQSLMFTGGNADDAETAFRRSISLAEALGDGRNEMHLLNGYAVLLHRDGRFSEALVAAKRAESLLPGLGDPEAVAIVDSLLGVAFHFVGRSAEARHHWERSVAYSARSLTDTTSKLGFDHHIRSLCGVARTHWLAGDYAKAFEVAEDTVAKARAFGHVVTRCIAIIWAGSVYIHEANTGRTSELMDELEFVATRHSLTPYRIVAAATRGQILVLEGRAAEGVEKIRAEVELLHECRYEMVTNTLLTTMAKGLTDLSLYSAALATCDDIARRIQAGGDLLRLPELLLVKGNALAAAGDREEAANIHALSLEVARGQGSRPGRLRAALAMAQQLVRDGFPERAAALLRPELAGAEDQTSPDLVAARSLPR